jgi:hypothetical protein
VCGRRRGLIEREAHELVVGGHYPPGPGWDPAALRF